MGLRAFHHSFAQTPYYGISNYTVFSQIAVNTMDKF